MSIQLSDIASGSGGFVLAGVAAQDAFGYSVSGAGDINGDGFDDLIAGTRTANPSGHYSGASYVVYGGNFSGAVTLAGTSAADTLTGTANADIMVGGLGNDTLIGGGGADVLKGGAGNDVLRIANLGFREVEGGSGTDTLMLTGASLALDLTQVTNRHLSGIEVIDLTGTGNNALVMGARAALRLSESSNTLHVEGDIGDRVTFDDAGWIRGATVGGYTTFTLGQASIQVRAGVTIDGPGQPIDLASIAAGRGGFVLIGEDARDISGRSVASAGDINGDGFDDIVIGAPGAGAAGNAKANAGDSYVVYGKAAGFGTSISLAAVAAGSGGFVIHGAHAGDESGMSVASAGDINGDGFADLVIGAKYGDAPRVHDPFFGPRLPGSRIDSGETYVVFGQAAPFAAAVELSAIAAGSGGFVIHGEDDYDWSGLSVASAGDFNGDGLDDIVIGALHSAAAANLKGDAGDSYVIFGKTGGFGPGLELANIASGLGGFVVHGRDTADHSGTKVGSAGDINGDGYADLVIGAPFGDAAGNLRLNAGESYVLFGRAGESGSAIDLANVAGGHGGFAIFGEQASDRAGTSVGTAGDFNGDGFDDVIIGAMRRGTANLVQSYIATSYLVFGSAAGHGPGIDLADVANGTHGLVIRGYPGAGGYSLASAGDVNGDGFDDLIMGLPLEGAPTTGKLYAGNSYVIFGRAGLAPASIDLAAIASGTGGFVIRGQDAYDRSGSTVASAGDIDGDGFDDLIVGDPGAPFHSPTSSFAGRTYVVFGRDFSSLVTHPGTTAADNLTGTANAGIMVGGLGNDTLIGGGGADVLKGGAGNDVLRIADLGFREVEGGSGVDTLAIAGGGIALFLTEPDPLRISGIEVIDITGNGFNALVLDTLAVLNLSDTSNALRVVGDSGDVLRFADLGWRQGATDLGYTTFTHGQASVQVAVGVAVSGINEPVDLNAIAAGNGGFVVRGAAAGDRSGTAVGSAGDFNGDGYADLIIGAPGDAAGNPGSGESYVVFGTAAGADAAIDLAVVAAGTGGFVIHGQDAFDLFGAEVATAGDLNGDGFDDLVIGAPLADGAGNATPDAGATWVVFGRPGNSTAPLDLGAVAAGSGGFVIHGEGAAGQSGRAVASAGDVNGDGFTDLLIGAPNSYGSISYADGDAYVVFGRSAGFGPAIDLAQVAAGSGGFVIRGESAHGHAGHAVAGAGDINGDGFDDIAVGSANPLAVVGDTWVVFGKATPFAAALSLGDIGQGSGGFVIHGVSNGDYAGHAVASAGDINGDGFADLVIGAFQAAAGSNYHSRKGESYVVFGKAGGFGSAVSLADVAQGSGGFAIFGRDTGDRSGYSVASGGDINGDGFSDLIIGAILGDGPEESRTNAGESYVVFGHAGGFGAVIHLAAIAAGSGGFVIQGEAAGDYSGNAVASAGDLNGDGFDDLVVGALLSGANGAAQAGSSYVIFGADFSGAVTHAGSARAEGLSGTTGADVMMGAQGDDTLFGGRGDDLLNGAAGIDTAYFSGNRSAYTVARNHAAPGFTVSGADGSDHLRDIEVLRFADSITLLASEARDAGIVDHFDAMRYLAGNPTLIDVFGADANAATAHYLQWGFHESRPVANFDGLEYLASNPLLAGIVGAYAEAGINHYVRWGHAEGRPTNTFNPTLYLASNPGLIGVYGADLTAATEHYVRWGFNEGRPTQGFDALRYLASNPALFSYLGFDQQAITTHYVLYGFSEHRSTTSFNPYRYLANHLDLLDFFGPDPAAATLHYLGFGYAEYRPLDPFNGYRYLASNPTLIDALGTDEDTAIEHFVRFGYWEHRPTVTFSAFDYLATNPTLIPYFADDPDTAIRHYVDFGHAEGRPTAGFDALLYLASNPGLLGYYGPETAAAISHYVHWGHAEGRPLDSFDGLEYIASNPGLIPYLGADARAGAGHYVAFGYGEGRPTASFDAMQYATNYGDLEGHSLTDARLDFINGGLNQGRTDAALPGSAGATAGAEELDGGNGADFLSGLGGADTLVGGLGNDTLVGGYGNDRFVFDMAPDATTNLDRIVDFTHNADKLVLENAVFTAIVDAGALAAGNFAANGTGSAIDADDFVVYNTVSGVLSYDADGNGAGAAVAFATLASHPAITAITAADFMVI